MAQDTTQQPVKKEIKARVFNIAQYEINPATLVPINFNENNIISGVNHKSIELYAYIRHDKDPYTEEDVERYKELYNRVVKVGDPKEPHWHIVLQCPSAVKVSVIAKWFGIPENQIAIPKGKNQFIDCVEYLRHSDIKQKRLGKFQYDESEVRANFDWQSAVDAYLTRKTRYNGPLSDRDWYRNEIYSGNMSLRELKNKHQTVYVDDCVTLERLRARYLSDKAPIPPTRINYYIDGNGGVGKGLLARALARSLYPDIKDDDDIFFNVGSKGSAFSGYDGQPVIIWNDRRAYNLLEELGGRDNVFNVFDTHPTRMLQNVKYGATMLCNTVNIINGIEDYRDFLDGLAGEYTDKNNKVHEAEDKNQAYRRLPFIIRVHADDFDIYINKGFLENTYDFREYLEYGRVRANMKLIAEMCGVNEQLAKQIQGDAVKSIVDKHNNLLQSINAQKMSDEEIIEKFKDSGELISIDKGNYELYIEWLHRELEPHGISFIPLSFDEFKAACKSIPDLREEISHYEPENE